MKRLPLLLVVVCLLAGSAWTQPGEARAAGAARQEKPPRVGQILIAGNKVTRQNIILERLPLYPGAVLESEDVRTAQRNLAALTLVGIYAEVSVLDDPCNPDAEYKDIRVHVREFPPARLFVLSHDAIDSLLGE